MKKIITFSILAFFLIITTFFNIKNVFAVSCSQVGNSTYCSDGTSYSQVGNTIYGNDGSSYSQVGNTIYGNDGSSCSGVGNSAYCSDGTSYSQVGNTIYGNDGSSYSQVGNTIYGNDGAAVIKNCPTNSSYNSLSGKCKCDYGYEVSGSGCIYKTITFPNTPSKQYPTENKCPANSHLSTTDATKCQCDYGFTINGAGDACITNIIRTNNTTNNTSDNQTCKEKHGADAYLGTDGECQCKDGYRDIFDDKCITYDEACKWYETEGKIMHGVGKSDGTYNCYSCNDGFYWDETKKECLKNNDIKIPSTQDTANKLKPEIKKQENNGVFKPTKKETADLKNNPTSHLGDLDSDNDTEVNPSNSNDGPKTGIKVKNTETTTTSGKTNNRIYSFFSSLLKKLKFW